MTVVIVTLIVDTAIGKIYFFDFSQSSLPWRIITFIVICCIYWPGVYLITRFTKHEIRKIRSRPIRSINALHKLVIISQFVLAGLTAFLLLQVILLSHYNATLLILVTWFSYTVTIITMTILH